MDMLVKSESLTSVADAIRTKGETSEQLVFPDGFATAIMAIQSGVSGATLTVTTPAEAITVTVTKGEASHTKTTGADKTATFTGLGTGTWTITISDGTQTATGTIDIDADYASELTFFAATINVTYEAGRVCTVSDGVTTLTAPDTSGTWACVVPNVGTWTVSVSGVDSTWPVTITANGQSETVDTTKVYLYNKGDQFTTITGGWTNSGYKFSGFKHNNNSHATVSSSIIQVKSISGADKDYGGIVGTANKVNISGFTTLKAKVSLSGYNSNSRYCVGVHTSKTITPSPLAYAAATKNGDQELTLTLPTNITSAYVFVMANTYPPIEHQYESTFEVTEIVLE